MYFRATLQSDTLTIILTFRLNPCRRKARHNSKFKGKITKANRMLFTWSLCIHTHTAVLFVLQSEKISLHHLRHPRWAILHTQFFFAVILIPILFCGLKRLRLHWRLSRNFRMTPHCVYISQHCTEQDQVKQAWDGTQYTADYQYVVYSQSAKIVTNAHTYTFR